MKTQNQRISIQQSIVPPQLRAKKSSKYKPPLILTPQMLQNQNIAQTPMNKLLNNNNSIFEKIDFEDNDSMQQKIQKEKKKKPNNRYNSLTNQSNSQKYRYESADDYADHSYDVNQDYRVTFNNQPKKMQNATSYIIPKKRNTQGNQIQLSKSNNQLKYNKSVSLNKPTNLNNQYMINSQLILRDKLSPKNGINSYVPITIPVNTSIIPSLYLNHSQYQSNYQPLYQHTYTHKANYKNKNKMTPSIQMDDKNLFGLTLNKKQSLQQIVKDLENHNKNIMKQTKRTVTDYQTYIEELLQSNAELQSNLLQYQNYIQNLQNQKLQLIQTGKERENYLQKVIRQKIFVQKQLKKQKQSKSQSPPTIQLNINQENKRKQQQICLLKQQLNKKQQNIKLFQQLITQKQGIIKNMANFNNEMCLQIMQLKKNIIWGEINKSNNKNTNSNQNKYLVQQNENHKQILKTLQLKLTQTLQENENLKNTNQQLQKQLKQFMNDDQTIVLHMQKQSRKISLLQKKIQILTNNLKKSKQSIKKLDKSQISCSIDLQKIQDEQNSIKKGEIYKNGKKIIAQNLNQNKLIKQNQQSQKTQNKKKLQTKSNIDKIDKQYDNYLNNQQELEQQHDGVLLRKINNVLQILYKNLKDHGKKQKYKQTIRNIMRTLTQIIDETTQLDIQNQSRGSMLKSNQDNFQNSNFLNNMEESQKNRIQFKKSSSQGCKIETNYTMENILQKNSQILLKIKQIKQKVKKHTNKANTQRKSKQSQQSSSDSQKLEYLNYIESNIDKKENQQVNYGNFQKNKKQNTKKQQQKNKNIYEMLQQLDKLNIKRKSKN